eukprot:429594-Pyramimonas_sp.AAC.1
MLLDGGPDGEPERARGGPGDVAHGGDPGRDGPGHGPFGAPFHRQRVPRRRCLQPGGHARPASHLGVRAASTSS